MITSELTKKIDTLTNDEYHMVETYVENILEYSKRRKKAVAWEKVKADLAKSEQRMQLEGGISSSALRARLEV